MNFVGNRRAISTVVTTVMMLTAVAVMGATLVAWSNGKLIVFESSLANSAANMTNTVNENLFIENIQFCLSNCLGGFPPHSGISVTLTNIGTIPVKINLEQINSTAYSPTSALPVTLMPKQSSTLIVNGLNPRWQSKDVSTFTFTTSRGSIFTTQAAAP